MKINTFQVLRNLFYITFLCLVYGVMAKIQHYPYHNILGYIGIFGVMITKFIPFYFDFKRKNWKLSILNYADVSMWVWIVAGAFTIINKPTFFPWYYVKAALPYLFVVTLILYAVHFLMWFRGQTKNL